MEEDRLQTNLGSEVEISSESVIRQPKKRFIGRRQATENAAKNNNSNIEENGAIQGQ